MPILTTARRVPSFDDLVQAGDYSGPHPIIRGDDREERAVYYLLPIHRGWDKFDHRFPGSGVHMCTEPPWVFRECADGSLEIRESIAAGEPRIWHGFLDRGNIWRELDDTASLRRRLCSQEVAWC